MLKSFLDSLRRIPHSPMYAGLDLRNGRSARRRRGQTAWSTEMLEIRELLSSDLSPALQSAIRGGSNAVNQLVDSLHDRLFDDVMSQSQPLIGSALNVKDTAADQLDAVSKRFHQAMQTLQALPEISAADLQQSLFDQLKALMPSTLIPSAGAIPVLGDKASEVLFRLPLQGVIVEKEVPFNPSLPFLLNVTNGNVRAAATWSTEIILGFSMTDGPFLDVTSQEDFKINLSVTAPNLAATGRLGILKFTATNAGSPDTGLTATLGVNIADGPNQDSRLTAAEISSLGVAATISGSASINLNLKTEMGDEDRTLPSIATNLRIHWPLNGSLATPLVSRGAAPTVEFLDVRVHVGEFFANTVRPIFERIDGVLDPLQPVFEVLTTRMPVLSDFAPLRQLFDKNRDNSVTLVEAIEAYSGEDVTLIQALADLQTVSNFVETLSSSGDMLLGSFRPANDVRTTPGALNALSHVDRAAPADSGVSTFISKLKAPSFDGKFSFPIIEDPESAFRLLLGQDIEIFKLEFPDLNAGFEMGAFIPVFGPAGVHIRGRIDVGVRLGFGYDTSGLRRWAEKGFTETDAGLVWDGFYIRDHVGGTDVREVYVEAGVTVAPGVDVVVAAAGLGGTLIANVGLDLRDRNADGRLRPFEIIDNLKEHGPFCGLFEFGGSFDAALTMYGRVGYGGVGFEDSYDIARTQLLDFTFGCSGSAPVLAELDQTTHTLRLNIGPRARYRGTHPDSVPDSEAEAWRPNESLTLRRLFRDELTGYDVVEVSGFGFRELHAGVAKIEGNGGLGNDVIQIAKGVTAELYLEGGAGNDLIMAGDHGGIILGGDGDDELGGLDGLLVIGGGAGNDVIHGGRQADIITAGDGNDVVFGHGGDDYINGDLGNDLLFGGAGNDELLGGNGDDDLRGEAGNDRILGLDGNDFVHGGAGDNELYGGDGDDFITTSESVPGNGVLRDGANLVEGDAGNDIILAGSGADRIFAGSGNDFVSAGPGRDVVSGGDGHDTLFGGAGDDEIYGGDGDDRIVGGVDPARDKSDLASIDSSDRDVIYAGAGFDTVHGGIDDDLIFGESGDDVLRGGSGVDTIYGAAGIDEIYGDEGDDELYGDDDNDYISGGVGRDRIRGGRGDDRIDGDADGDAMFGETGNDVISGGGGDDLIDGAEGDDELAGDAGADRIDGGAGHDQLFGHSRAGTGDDGAADELNGGDGDDWASGGGGDDILYGEAGIDSLHGNDGDDRIYAGTGIGDALFGGRGNDLIAGSDEGSVTDPDFSDLILFGDVIFGGEGNDTIFSLGGADFISADDGDDRVDSGAGADFIRGGNGDDVLYAGVGYGDRIEGEAGDDMIYGADLGQDTLLGGAGNDRLFGQGLDDVLSGGDGDDELDGGAGTDQIFGETGNDTLHGGGGNGDVLEGGTGSDVLNGSDDGADIIRGGDGRDTAYGFGGNDVLDGGLDDDILDGGDGDDLLLGGAGSDLLIGGAQHDTLYGHSESGADDDGAVDFLYGDFGTNRNETNSGRDRLSGQNGNDRMWGEGEDDLLNAGAGNSQIVDYGAGEAAAASDFVPPTATAAPPLKSRAAITWAGATLTEGTETAGRWSELGGSGTVTGLSRSPSAAVELTMAIDSAGVRYAAWADSRNGNFEIYVAKYVMGAGWQEMSAATSSQAGGSASEGGISRTPESSRRPSLAIGADNQPIVAWTEGAENSSDIRVARFEPAAFGGAGGWVALGSSLSILGISGTGAADSAQLIHTIGGPVVAWLDSSVSGRTNVFIKRFDGADWHGLGGAANATSAGLTASTGHIPNFAVATDGHRVSVAWTQPNASGSDIYLTEFGGQSWSPLSASSSGEGISRKPARNQTPAVAYAGDDPVVAWQGDAAVRPEIFASVFRRNEGTWQVIGNATTGVSQTQGLASEPQLVSRGGRLTLAWIDEARANRRGRGQSVFVAAWNGTAFVPDAGGDQLPGGITGTELVRDPVLAADASGRPQIGWTSPAETADGVSGEQVFLRADLTNPGGRRFVAGGGTTVQYFLDNFDLEPGDRIDVVSDTAGFNVSLQDSGVTIVGLPGVRITSQVTVTNASDVVLQSMHFAGSVLVHGGSRITIADSAILAGTTITGTADLQFVRNTVTGTITGLALDGTLRPVVRANQFSGTEGIRLFGTATTDVKLLENTIRSVTGIHLQSASTGEIRENDVTGGVTGLRIAAAFGGIIERNHIHDNQTGIEYSAAAALSDNRVRKNTTGIVAGPGGTTVALGFVSSDRRPVILPNVISENAVGVRLNGGRMQSQTVRGNGIGVTGAGELVAADFDHANVIERNTLGVSITGPVQFNRIRSNAVGVDVTDGQLIAHNVISRNTQAGLRMTGRTDVRVVHNTLYSPIGDLIVAEQNARELFVSGNVFWVESGTALKIDNSSQTGFWSDFNLLHASGTGKLVSWSGFEFTDILDWQQDVGLFDLHSNGRTAVNPGWSEPRFVSRATDDLHTPGLRGGQRFSDPSVNAGDARQDVGLPPESMNLLANSSFEAGLTGWTTNVEARALLQGLRPFDGAMFAAAGDAPTGFAAQDVVLTGFTEAELDSGLLNVVFSGRLRSKSETQPDSGRILVRFFDSNATLLGESAPDSVSNSDRWVLQGGVARLPAGTRRIQYRFESVRATGTSNDAYFDSAMLRIQREHIAPDVGAFGGTRADLITDMLPAVPQLRLISPDLYLDHERDKRHTIRWESAGNTSDHPVRIDVYRDGAHGPEFLVNLAMNATDSGSFEWIPSAFGIGYGTHGLRIQIQLVGDEIVLDRGTEPFSVAENTNTFFVNDRATANDEWTSAAGNNRFTGRVASAPKPLPTTILRTYAVTAGSTLYLDSGSYRLFQPLVVSNSAALGDDEGFLFTGPTSVARVAKMGHANPFYTPFPVVTLNDADEMQLAKFSVEGGTHGLLIHNGSERVTVTDLKISGASSDGLRFESSASGSEFLRIISQNNVGAGIRVNGPINSIRQSEVTLNQSAGISLTSPGDVVLTRNLVAGNYGTGILIAGGSPTVGNSDLTLNLGNRVLNNRFEGIVISNTVSTADSVSGLVAGNTVSGHSAGAGIRFAGLILNNVVNSNQTGIEGTTVHGNRVYNSSTGIILKSTGLPTVAAENIVYSNTVGIVTSAATQPQTVRNNLVYANSSTAIEVQGRARIINNTIQIAGTGYGVRAVANPVPVSDWQLRNNIIVATGSSVGISVPSSAQNGFVSDFNLIHTTARTARIGEWQGSAHSTLQSWQRATFGDANSLSANPQFVDADGADNVPGAGTSSDGRDDNFHVSSEYGSVRGGGLAPVIGTSSGLPEFQSFTFLNDATTSPALDRGAASDAFVNEPTPNGHYANLGAYGNTAQASRSPSTYVLVTSPNGDEIWPGNQTFPIRWRAESLTGNVRIELLDSDYGFRALIAESTPNDGEFLWTVPPELAAEDHQIRITRLDATGAVDESDDLFTTTSAIRHYFVNDGIVRGDFLDWTNVAGDDNADGLTPSTPKASIRAVLDAYDLGPGDVIFVDMGVYNLTANIVITDQDSGVEIRGYHTTPFENEQNAVGEDRHLAATLNRGNQTSGSYVFQFNGADDVILNHLGMTGASIGVVALNGADSDRIVVRMSEFRNMATGGVLIEASNDGPQIVGNRISEFQQYGVRMTATNAATVRDNVVFATNSSGSFGIDVTSEAGKPESNLIEGNHVYAVETGIRTVAGSTTAGMTVRANVVHDTRLTGIAGSGVIEKNQVYDNQGTGISGSFIYDNVVFGNQTGIQGSIGTISKNRVYRNVTGISASSSTTAENRVYSNSVGLNVGSGETRNNLVYDNAADEIIGAFNSVIQNNTIHHSAGGNAIRIRSTNARLLNNIIQVDDGIAIVVETAAQSGFASNYNLFRPDEDARVGLWGTTLFAALNDWTDELNLDRDSRLGDPLFVNTFGNDERRGFSNASVAQPQEIDNGDAQFSVDGSWDHVTTFSRDPQGKVTPILYETPTAGTGYWPIETGRDIPVSPNTQILVSAGWPAHRGHGTVNYSYNFLASYTVTTRNADGSTTEVPATSGFSGSLGPVNQAIHNGGFAQFVALRFPDHRLDPRFVSVSDARITGTVSVSGAYAAAASIEVGSGIAGSTKFVAGTGGFATPGFNGDYHRRPSTETEASASWEFTDLPEGEYSVSANWTQYIGNSINATFAIYDGDRLVRWVTRNQSPGSVDSIGLGIAQIKSGRLIVRLSGAGNLHADRVWITRIGGDNGSDDDYRTLAGSPAIDFGDPASGFSLEPVPNGGRVNAGHTGNTSDASVSASEVLQVLSPNGREKLEQGADVSIRWRSHGLVDPRGTYSDLIAADAPLAWYRLGESSGTVAADSSGNSRTGTYFGSPVLSSAGSMAAEPDRSIRVTSSNGGVTVPYSAAMSPAQFTVEAWVNPDTSISTFNNLITRSNFGNAADGYGLMWYQDKLRFHVNHYTGAGTVDADVSKGVWSHVVAIFDGSALRLYVNGVLATSKNYATPVSYANYQTTIGGTWRGGIDDVAIYDRPLTADQVLAHYQRGTREVYGTVRIEAYRPSQPDVMHLISASTPADGQFSWTVPASMTEGQYRLRITQQEGLRVWDESDREIQIVSSGNHYYVNDGSLVGDVFTTAAGNNSNTGKSPDQPMASLTALLAAFDLDAGDIIHLDSGTYNIAGTIVISAQDSGVSIRGPQAVLGTAPSSEAVLNRGGQTAASQILFDLQNADDVTLEGLTLTNAFKAIHAASNSDSDRLTVSGNRIVGNATGVEIWSTNDNTVITLNSLSGNTSAIVGQSVSGLSLIQNTIQATGGTAVRIITSGSDPAVVRQNQLNGSSTAIDVSGYFTVVDNIIQNPTSFGIAGAASTNLSSVSSNRITGSGVTNTTGIRLQGGTASDNVVSSMGVGIDILNAATASNNRVLNNTLAGLIAAAGTVRGNTVYSNAAGVVLSSSARAENNLIYDNWNVGIWIRSGSGNVIENNTIVQASTGDAIQVGGADPDFGGAQSASQTTLRNNILVAGSGYALHVAADSQSGLASDFNLFHMPGNGKVVKWEDREFQLRSEWSFATGFDLNSVQGEPQFENAVGPDGILGYRTSDGQDYGLDDDFRVRSGSISIDAGALDSSSALEPVPNGGRINLGHTGNTGLATTSADRMVQLISPNGGEKFQTGVPVTVQWRSNGLRNGGVTDPTVNLEITRDAGATWFPLATSLPIDANGNGSWTWVPTGETDGNTMLLRITANVINQPQDLSDGGFLITNNGQHFYINDHIQSGDVFTTQIGSDSNSGKTPDRPMFTLAALLRAYDLEPGDVIHVDSGSYRVYSNIILLAQDSGVRIEGPGATPEGRVLQSVAQFNRGNTVTGASVFELSGIDDATIDNLSITGAEVGIFAASTADSDRIRISNNAVFNNLRYGINFETGTGLTLSEDTIVSGNRVSNHTGPFSAGIRVRSLRARIEDNEVFGNQDGIDVVGDSVRTTVHTVISGNTVRNNLRYGIIASELVSVTRNTAYGQSAAGAAGIFVSSTLQTTEVSENVVHSNTTGIRGFSEVSGFNPAGVLNVRNNRVYNNGRGIQAHRWTRVEGNQVFSNSIGISGESTFGFNGAIVNNVIYANTNQAIFIERSSASGGQIVNNTIHQIVGDAIRIDNASQGLTVRNNILALDSGRAIVVSTNSQSGFVSNSNLILPAANANTHVGFWNNANQTTLSQWRTASSQDSLSIQGDPRFIDRDGADNIYGYDSSTGRNGGDDDNFHLARGSDAIDRANGTSAPAMDRDRRSRSDDPDTVNSGTPIDLPFADIGAYEFAGASSDVAPPAVLTSEILITGSADSPTYSLRVKFSEPMDSISTLSRAAWDLRSAGPNGIFDDSDDVVWQLSPVPSASPGATMNEVSFIVADPSAWPQGDVRLRILGENGPRDLSGNTLDGDGDGTEGGDFVRFNSQPRLAPLPDASGFEHLPVVIHAVAQDPNAGQSLTWSLEPGAPAGAVIDPSTGTIQWTPSEEQGGKVFQFAVRVTDDSAFPMSHIQGFRIAIAETNSKPVISPVGESTIAAGRSLTLQLSVSDSDAPAQRFTWGLAPAAPPGSTIDPVSGLFSWLPPQGMAPGRYEIPVFISDNGSGPSFDTSTIVVVLSESARPVLKGPAGSVETHYPQIIWNPVEEAVAYDVWIGSLISGAVPPVLGSTPSTSFVPGQPLGIGRHRIWVRAVFSNGLKSAWSIPKDFVVAVRPSLLSLDRLQASARPTVSWTPVTGAVQYDIWIDNESTGQVRFVRKMDVQGTSWTPETDMPLGSYRIWVRAIDLTLRAAMWSNHLVVVVATRPTASSPVDSTFDRTPTFSWNPVAGATSYDLQIRPLKNPGEGIRNIVGLTSTNWTPPTDLTAGPYVWWIRANSEAGIQSLWSLRNDVYVGGRPNLLTPIGMTDSTTPEFRWSPVDGAVRYELWVTDLTRELRVIHEKSLTKPSFTPLVALPASDFRFWVRAVSSEGETSFWSLFTDFSISTR